MNDTGGQHVAGAVDRFDLSGRVAVVTGGSRGLGSVISRAFAERGATVVLASRNEAACIDYAKTLSRETGTRAMGLGCHVGKWSDCEQLTDRVYSEFGRLDVLVNNAGMSPLYPSLAEVSEELFDKVISVNLKGPFRLAALVGTRMASEGPGGSIINVSSVGSIAPSPDELPYAAAKAGLNTLTVGMAQAFGPTVRVNTIMPGAFHTDATSGWDSAAADAFAKRSTIAGRFGSAGEIVGAAVFLASDAASYVTGSTITVDGGMSARHR